MKALMEDRRALAGGVIVAAICLAIVAVLSGRVTALLAGDADRVVRAEFADAQQLRPSDPVRIDGVSVGRVGEIERVPGRPQVVVTMELDEAAGPLYANARAHVRWRTLLGGSFSVALERGSRDAGALRTTIPLERTSGQVEIEDLLQATGGGARRGLRTMPRELARAFAGRDALRSLVTTLADVSPSVAAGVGAARGHDAGTDLRRLIRTGAQAASALNAPHGRLRGLVADSASTFEAVAGRRAELEETIARLPGALATTRSRLGQLDGALDVAEPVLERLNATASRVAPTVRRLRPTVVRAAALLSAAEPLLDQLRPAAASVARMSANALPTLRALLPSLDRTQKSIIPMLAEKDPITEKSTSVMIGGAFAALGTSAMAPVDQNGHYIRFPLALGSSPAYLPCQSYVNNPDKDQVVECMRLNSALKSVLTDPLGPAPGSEGTPEPEDGR